jgi:uncharacterized protein (UPF0332 family)/predicted nucleotidyltransferase
MAEDIPSQQQKVEMESIEEPKPKLVTERDVATDFAVKVHRKFDRLIKASILFGSQAKNLAVPGSDIDIILIVDDAAISWDMELIAWYREELAKIVAESQYRKELHINTVKLTTWWQDLLYGDPVVINIIRYGEALIDVGGFFNPLKALLIQGKIRSTPEAVYAALSRAPSHLARSRASEMGAIEGVYWAMIDAAQALLITAGKVSPSPEHIPQMLKQTFVDVGLLDQQYVISIKDLYNLHKGIAHGSITNIKGVDVDMWQEKAEKFLQEASSLILKMIQNPK